MSHDHNNTRLLPAHAWWGVNRKADPCRFSPSLLHKHLLSWGEGGACGTAAPALALHAKSQPAAKIITRPLPRSFSTAYSYSMYTNHSLFSTVLDLACQPWHATIGTMSASAKRVSLMLQGFYFTFRGAEALTKGSVFEWVWPSWFPLLHRLVQWSAWVNSPGRKKGLIDDRKLFGQMGLNCP